MGSAAWQGEQLLARLQRCDTTSLLSHCLVSASASVASYARQWTTLWPLGLGSVPPSEDSVVMKRAIRKLCDLRVELLQHHCDFVT